MATVEEPDPTTRRAREIAAAMPEPTPERIAWLRGLFRRDAQLRAERRAMSGS